MLSDELKGWFQDPVTGRLCSIIEIVWPKSRDEIERLKPDGGTSLEFGQVVHIYLDDDTPHQYRNFKDLRRLTEAEAAGSFDDMRQKLGYTL